MYVLTYQDLRSSNPIGQIQRYPAEHPHFWRSVGLFANRWVPLRRFRFTDIFLSDLHDVYIVSFPFVMVSSMYHISIWSESTKKCTHRRNLSSNGPVKKSHKRREGDVLR
ncbi:hypothetical protein BDV28DRAFT_65908 [Aspergillus coremiiformis]|uniref:Uncharacterized protein n=1 Tax=Aspergillus coremiiformis TaxID=138285 RepID=A0A5N6ZB68_9EURO|nr:hypothetical protein BDV28DRAFT_65908 [Aspergillus coremiiformis]